MTLSMERLANACLVVCALLVGASSARQMWRGVPVSRSADVYAIGEKAPIFAGVEYGKHDQTLLMFINSQCQYCTASMPFYNRLSTARAHSSQRLQMVALSTEDPASLKAYLERYGLSVDSTVSDVETTGLKLRSTPALIAVNSDGLVLNEWIGQVANALEGEVLGALNLTLSIDATHSRR